MTPKKFFNGVCRKLCKQKSLELDSFMNPFNSYVDEIMNDIKRSTQGGLVADVPDPIVEDVYGMLDNITVQSVNYYSRTQVHQLLCTDDIVVSCFRFNNLPVITLGDYTFHGHVLYVGNDPQSIVV